MPDERSKLAQAVDLLLEAQADSGVDVLLVGCMDQSVCLRVIHRLDEPGDEARVEGAQIPHEHLEKDVLDRAFESCVRRAKMRPEWQ